MHVPRTTTNRPSADDKLCSLSGLNFVKEMNQTLYSFERSSTSALSLSLEKSNELEYFGGCLHNTDRSLPNLRDSQRHSPQTRDFRNKTQNLLKNPLESFRRIWLVKQTRLFLAGSFPSRTHSRSANSANFAASRARVARREPPAVFQPERRFEPEPFSFFPGTSTKVAFERPPERNRGQ